MSWSTRNVKVHESESFHFPPLPEGPWPVLYADPPWAYQNWTDKAHGAAKSWYETLTVDKICSLPVQTVAAKDSLLFLWATGPKLQEALQVVQAWGFEYVGFAFDWLKTYRRPVQISLPTKSDVLDLCDRFCSASDYSPFLTPQRVKTATIIPGNMYCGLGFRTRQANEICLLGKRGKGLPKKSSSVLAPVISKRRKHSQKPVEVYNRIEELVDGPFLELFARNSHPGWTAWGQEASNGTDDQTS